MSWGYKLMITFIVFATMMSYMVYRSFNTHFELVEPEYYKSELKYQQVIDGSTHADSLSSTPSIIQSGEIISFRLPKEMTNKNITGSILFYCAYDSRKDKRINISVDTAGVQMLDHLISPGFYTVKIEWNNEHINYYSEKKIRIL